MSKARIILPIEGMTCASCAATVEEARAGASGVASAGVNFATNKAAIEYDSAQTNVAQLIRTVREAGYNCGKASVTVGYTPGGVSADDLEQAVSAAGFEVAAPIAAEDPLERERIARSREIRTLTWKFVVAAVVAVIGAAT